MKRETHRPGDDPPFDEHANEESYFAAKEHDLVEDLKSEFRKDETARRAAQMAICPKCSGKFAPYRFMGFDFRTLRKLSRDLAQQRRARGYFETAGTRSLGSVFGSLLFSKK